MVEIKRPSKSNFGEGVELFNFNYNDSSGLTPKSFNFDGQDDYIKVKYDDAGKKKDLAENGFTFEFYGIWERR